MSIQILTPHNNIEQLTVQYDGHSLNILMPVSELIYLLGDPIEKRDSFNYVPNHNYALITLEYPDISFIYHNFFEDPFILFIAFRGKNILLGTTSVIGSDILSINNLFGTPERIESNDESFYYGYEHWLVFFEYILLQFEFDSSGICIGVIIQHSSISI